MSALKRFLPLFLVSSMIASLCVERTEAQQAGTRKFDFGSSTYVADGYVSADNLTLYSDATGYGWVSNSGLLLRDRGAPNDPLRRDFVFNNTGTVLTFRVSGLPAGKYLMKVLCGDANYGDHVISVTVPGEGTLPTIWPRAAQFLSLSATVSTSTGTLDITFGSPSNNWIVNALTLEPSTNDVAPFIESSTVNEWDASVFATDPTGPLLGAWRQYAEDPVVATGLSRDDYLRLISGEVDAWKARQNPSGAIIDPYANSEIQYSTPAFANAAALLVVYGKRSDLIEPATLAMDWATLRLHNRLAAGGHEDFYPGMLVHALKLLRPYVASSRVDAWKSNLNYDPYLIYRQGLGSMNWNVVSSCGEALLQLQGIRTNNLGYVAESWAAQGRHFTSPCGLYLEGPMAYDHFPRIFLADALAQGYSGPYSAEVRQALDRAAITSLFMQSPWGELPAGGRSAHHQWNEAEQCVTYEIYAARAKAAGDLRMAGVYKRAAHLALSSMLRWLRPSGEMQVLKNWVDPSARHGYESYSYFSQYNLLPMAMLAAAYEYAAATEGIPERSAPADTGGFVFEAAGLHKVYANVAGTYAELEIAADHHYDATSLIRVHQKGVLPQLGPSDSLLSAASYNTPADAPLDYGIGVSWQDPVGVWRTLGAMGSNEIASVTVVVVAQSSSRVAFDVTYSGAMAGLGQIIEHYVVTSSGVQLTTELPGYTGPLRYAWPVLSNDGRTQSTFTVRSNSLFVSMGGAQQLFTAPGAQSLRVESGEYSNHNGWARVAVAEFANTNRITLIIGSAAPSVDPANISASLARGVLSMEWPPGQGWRLQVQTNSSWLGLGTNWFDLIGAGMSSTNFTIDPAEHSSFYRLVYP